MSKTFTRILIGLCLFIAGAIVDRFITPVVKPTLVSNAPSDARAPLAREAVPAEAKLIPALTETARPAPAIVPPLTGKLASEAQYDELLQRLVEWAKTDPQAALDYVRQQLPPQSQGQAQSAILSQWTKINPQAAWNWTTNNMPKDLQQVDAVLSQLGRSDAATAWSFATNFAQTHSDAAASVYVSALRGMLYGGDYEKAAQLAAGANLPEEKGAFDLSSMVVGQWANYDPEKASAWAGTLPEGSIRDQAMVTLGESWSKVDPQSAAAFAAGLPPGKTRAAMLMEALPNWAEQNPVAAADWLNQQERTSDFDQAINQILGTEKFQEDKSAALAWAKTISDSELQTQALTRIIVNMMAKDPAAAMNYLQTSPDLSPAMREDIRHRIDSRDLYSANKPGQQP